MLLKSNKRIEYLDSVRGIASILVLVYHVICSHWDWTTLGKIGKIFFNGTGAVAMFFVLSGLVLSLKLINTNIDITPKFMTHFCVKMIFRIYPAFLFVLIFYVYQHNGHINALEIVEEALLIRGRHILFIPDWTLGVEMALSLFVPFMVLIVRKNEKLLIWFLIMTLIIGSGFISEFILLFGLGIIIGNRFQSIEKFDSKAYWFYRNRYYLIPFILVLFSYRHITNIFPLPTGLNYFMKKILSLSEYTFSGLGSFLILILIINSKRIQNLLLNKALVFIGKISYGIYLSHWFFTKLVMNNFDSILTNYAFGNKTFFFFIYLVFTLLCSIISGWFIYRFIELPFIDISKKLLKQNWKRNLF